MHKHSRYAELLTPLLLWEGSFWDRALSYTVFIVYSKKVFKYFAEPHGAVSPQQFNRCLYNKDVDVDARDAFTDEATNTWVEKEQDGCFPSCLSMCICASHYIQEHPLS